MVAPDFFFPSIDASWITCETSNSIEIIAKHAGIISQGAIATCKSVCPMINCRILCRKSMWDVSCSCFLLQDYSSYWERKYPSFQSLRDKWELHTEVTRIYPRSMAVFHPFKNYFTAFHHLPLRIQNFIMLWCPIDQACCLDFFVTPQQVSRTLS